jgi:hypothetical protein
LQISTMRTPDKGNCRFIQSFQGLMADCQVLDYGQAAVQQGFKRLQYDLLLSKQGSLWRFTWSVVRCATP